MCLDWKYRKRYWWYGILYIYIYIHVHYMIYYMMRLAWNNWYQSHPQMPSMVATGRQVARAGGRQWAEGRWDVCVVASCCEGEVHNFTYSTLQKDGKVRITGLPFCFAIGFYFSIFLGVDIEVTLESDHLAHFGMRLEYLWTVTLPNNSWCSENNQQPRSTVTLIQRYSLCGVELLLRCSTDVADTLQLWGSTCSRLQAWEGPRANSYSLLAEGKQVYVSK